MAEELLGNSEEKKPEIDLNAIPAPKIEEVKKSPTELMVEALVDYKFLAFANGKLNVTHKELTQYLTPICLKVGNIVKRGTVLAALNGGVQNIDQQTQSLNACIATASVGFAETLKINLLDVEDTDLIVGLYVAVVSYQNFFRSSPLGISI